MMLCLGGCIEVHVKHQTNRAAAFAGGVLHPKAGLNTVQYISSGCRIDFLWGAKKRRDRAAVGADQCVDNENYIEDHK